MIKWALIERCDTLLSYGVCGMRQLSVCLSIQFSPDVVLANWSLVHRLWHASQDEIEKFLADVAKSLDDLEASTGATGAHPRQAVEVSGIEHILWKILEIVLAEICMFYILKSTLNTMCQSGKASSRFGSSIICNMVEIWSLQDMQDMDAMKTWAYVLCIQDSVTNFSLPGI